MDHSLHNVFLLVHIYWCAVVLSIRQKRGGGNGHEQEMTDSRGRRTAGVGTKDKCKMSAKRGVVAGVEPAME